MAKCLILFAFLSVSKFVFATTFAPISIKQQIKQSDGLVYGEVLSVESLEENGLIHSKVTVLANNWIGLNPKENLVELYFPGGKLGPKVFKIHGSPKFQIGENVMLFTKWHKEKIWINNLGLGKYSAKKFGSSTVLVNQIYPSHPEMGQMHLDKFIELSEWVKKEKFKERLKDKYEISYRNGLRVKNQIDGRTIASLAPRDYSKKEGTPIFWFVIILGLMAIVAGFIRKRTK